MTSYLNLSENEFSTRVKQLNSLLESCELCPRKCKVNRLKNELGFCRTGKNSLVSSQNMHFGEEPPISGLDGSGTIFFTHCNLQCVFCQNYPISQLGNGNEITIDKLAEIMLWLQKCGAHNINLVTPSHVIPQFVEAVYLASRKGLNIPLVYNSSGYDSVDTLKYLDGIVDIYMPDAKYWDDKNADKYSSAISYREFNSAALKEMYRQVGNLALNKDGIAVKGLLIRHLVLPNNIAGSEEILKFVAKEISPDTYMSIMAQYHPANKSDKIPELSRRVTQEEYDKVLDLAEKLCLVNGWHQEF